MIYVFDYATLKVIWWAVVGLLLVGFAILDGWDLGVGMLLPIRRPQRRRAARRAQLRSGPTWEGNQVWFITAGGATFAAWPLVYATAFSGFYIALIVVLFALFLRPVGLRLSQQGCRIRAGAAPGTGASSSPASYPRWCSASPSATCCWASRFISMATSASFYTGSFFGLLNPFALLAGLVSVAMLTMHGGLYLQLRTDGAVQARAIHAARIAGIVVRRGVRRGRHSGSRPGIDGFQIVAMPPADSAFAPAREDRRAAAGRLAPQLLEVSVDDSGATRGIRRARRWRSSPRPGAASACALVLSSHRRHRRRAHRRIRVVPVHHAVVERSRRAALTAWDAVSSYRTLQIMFWAVVIFMPLIIAYTSWVYRVMRGKVTTEHVRRDSHSLY